MITLINLKRIALLTAAAGTLGTASSFGVIEYDQDVTSAVIVGTGIGNGGFTTDRNEDSGVELGLRGKLRFNNANAPENTFNSQGDGTYEFATGTPPTGFGWLPGSPTTPIWNFEWSVNSDYNGNGTILNALTYVIGIDFEASLATFFYEFDPINLPWADHGIGTNATAQSDGVEAADATAYSDLISQNNLAQNSWNMEFFNNGIYDIFDPNADGTYDIYLKAMDANGGQVARTDIQIIVGNGGSPVPDASSTAALLGAGILSLLGFRRFSKRS